MLKRGRTMLVALIACLAMGACYSVRYTTHRAPEGPEWSHWNHFFLYGLVGEARVELWQLCPYGIASAEVTHTFLDGVFQAVTIGIWTPTTTRYRCAAPAHQASDSPGVDEIPDDTTSPESPLVTSAEGR